MSRNQRLARLLLALTGLSLLAAAFAWQCRRQDVPADEAALTARLTRLGYQSHAEPRDRIVTVGGKPRLLAAGLYFVRASALPDGAPWESVAAGPPSRWRGVVVAKPRGPFEPAPDSLAAGPWLLMGDPGELDRVAAALGLVR
jgi:hypothetical protein